MLCGVYQVDNEFTSPRFARAFSQGARLPIKKKYDGIGWAGFGSPVNWQDLQNAINRGKEWYYGDHAYFGRHRYYRITKNAYQHSGIGESDCERFLSHKIPIKPWRTGCYILVCPQSDVFFGLHNVSGWLENTISEIKKHTDRPIKVRTKKTERPIEADLMDAHCTVVYTSNAAVNSILAGIPAICTEKCAASIMSGSIDQIENLPMPDNRLEWAGVLADNQWTLAEIARGRAWEKLNEKI